MSNLVGNTGQIYSFEAERQFFRELVENIKLSYKSNIKPYPAWIGNETKTSLVDCFYGTTYSSVYSPQEKPYPLIHCTLDSFNFKDIALIKIDVECTEDPVLEGAYQTIMDSRPVIIIELMGGFGCNLTPEIQAKINKSISILNFMGYRVSKIWIDDYLALPNEKY